VLKQLGGIVEVGSLPTRLTSLAGRLFAAAAWPSRVEPAVSAAGSTLSPPAGAVVMATPGDPTLLVRKSASAETPIINPVVGVGEPRVQANEVNRCGRW